MRAVRCIGAADWSPDVGVSGSLPVRRQNFSTEIFCCGRDCAAGAARRENTPEFIAVMAISIAADAFGASKAVTNSSSFLRLLARNGLPLGRRTLARHLPGSRSKALTTNALYSMPAPRWSLRRCRNTWYS